MENWVIAITFTLPHEAHLAKVKLESEGIETDIRDELTVQVNNFYSNAIGGVKLLVKENDLSKAKEVLKDGKYIENVEEPPPTQSLTGEKQKLASKGVYWISLVMIAFCCAIVLYIVVGLPKMKYKKLTSFEWCFNGMYYGDYEFNPNTLADNGNKIRLLNKCAEKFIFQKSGIVYLPGFDSEKVEANWKLSGNELSIWPKEGSKEMLPNKEDVVNDKISIENIYYGVYEIEFEYSEMTLRSENQVIYAYR